MVISRCQAVNASLAGHHASGRRAVSLIVESVPQLLVSRVSQCCRSSVCKAGDEVAFRGAQCQSATSGSFMLLVL